MPAQAPPPAPAVRTDKRTAILDAALDLFCELTFEGTPVPLIAGRAHVGAGTIYRYFESKEALGNAVYQRWKGEMKRRLVDEAPRDVTAREGFSHWWRTLWAFATEHPRALAFLENHHHAPYLDADSHAVGDALQDGAIAFVRRAQRSGDIARADAHVLIALVMGAFRGLATALQDQRKTPTARLIDESEERVWEMLRA
jgi:TetR/AcrR family transcriptional regulator, repressor of fatR-cypB operon